MRRGLFAVTLFVLFGFLSTMDVASAAPKAKASCPALNATSADLICAKVAGKLVWKKRTSQSIAAVTPVSIPLSARAFAVFPVASSFLPVTIRSAAPDVCAVSSTGIDLLVPGACVLEFEQLGTKAYAPKLVVKRIAVMGENQVSLKAPGSALLSQVSASVQASSTSGLPVNLVSKTETVCRVGVDGQVQMVASGLCTIQADQPGNEFYPPATASASFPVLAANSISFNLPTQSSLSTRVITLQATSTSGQPVIFSAAPETICRFSGTTLTLLAAGTCTVTATQPASGYFAEATPVVRSITVTGGRSTVDQPDLRYGYQLQFVYVVPSDGIDNSSDVNGLVTRWIDEGQRFVASQLGVIFPIDSTATGYDIRYLKSRYSIAQLARYTSSYSCDDADALLASEIGVDCRLRSSAGISKYYVFLVEVPNYGGYYCGYAGRPGNISMVAVGNGGRCTGPAKQFTDYVVATWIHEVLHGLGVEHMPAGSCDLMQSGGSCRENYSMDKSRSNYVGASRLGVDILTFGFWVRPG